MLPEISHLQALVLSALAARGQTGSLPGRKLRGALGTRGVSKTLAAFYQLMARMEAAGLVDGGYEPLEVNGHKVRERRYRLLKKGSVALGAARRFYRELKDP